MTTWMRPIALAAIALTATACGAAAGSYDHPGCVSARDAAVIEGMRWLSDVEIATGRTAGPDGAVFDTLFGSCSVNPEAAYSDFLVRTHAGFEPFSPAGEVAKRQFLNSGCGGRNPYPFGELSEEAQRVCTGG